MMRTVPTVILVSLSLLPATAQAWDPFRTPNPHIEAGNARMAAERPDEALEAYDRAARELPSEPGVHLNRGIALLDTGQVDEARSALLTATEPSASASIRADAYYNLGLLYYRQGDATAAQGDHASAQSMFREAADAFKRSLRARPGNRDAGWNLELALRRIQEQEEEQQKQEEEQQDEQQDDEQQDEQQDDEQQDQQDDEQQDDDEQEPQEQDQDDASQEPQDEQDPREQGQDDGSQEQGQEDEPEQDTQTPEGGDEGGEEAPGEEGAPEQDRPLPREAERILDALEGSEDNLWRHRARSRGAQERRRPAKDW